MSLNIDPSVITLVQTTFLQHTAAAFATVARYALNLLYLFAALELVLFGIGWALQQNAMWEKLFFKIIKIGLILIIIQNYPDFSNAIMSSFGVIAGIVINKAKVGAFIFNPVEIWQYGYDVGIFMLKSATEVGGMGLMLILVLLGIGMLLVFGLLGIQVVLQMVSFYLVALVGLITLPLGIFEPSRRMFDRVVQAILQAGVRVMTVMIVIGMAVVVLDNFDLNEMGTKVVNLNQSLGLFFTTLLFLFLAIHLPRLAASAIGEISDAKVFVGGVGSERATGVAAPFVASPIAGIISDLSAMQAAVAMDNAALAMPWQSTAAVQSAAVEVSGNAGFTGTTPFGVGGKAKAGPIANSMPANSDSSRIIASSQIVSSHTLKKLREVLTKISDNQRVL